MKKPVVVINIVGLTQSLLGENTPNINRLINDGYLAQMEGVFPALTCSAQASMMTGVLPSEHGIVGNGWYFRDLAEIGFWKQSNRLVQGEKVWQQLKKVDSTLTCAQLFWWYNMYADVDFSVTPRPIYPADGRKIPAIYSYPSTLCSEIENDLSTFPFFNFWGPAADIRSSQWIADSAQWTMAKHHPALTFVYLPHLDYNLQRLGPQHPDIWKDVKEIDRVAGQLIDFSQQQNADVLIVSEYGIEQASVVISINQILRTHGFIAVRDELGYEILDCGASRAFAVVDHQIAHIYVKNLSDIAVVRTLLSKVDGIEFLLHGKQKAEWGIDHARAGEIVAVAAENCWFNYYYWLSPDKAPDFARTVDIHRKPGYDPVELFMDPTLRFPKIEVALKVLKKKLGMRMLMDVIPLMPELVKGTHGRKPALGSDLNPILIGSNKKFASDNIAIVDIKSLIVNHFK